MKRRLIYLTFAFVCFLLCVLIVKLFNNQVMIRGFVGDVIVVVLIYFLAKSFYQFKPAILALFVLIIAFSTEIVQYMRIIKYIGLEGNRVAELTIGAVFDPMDLLAYSIGVTLVYLFDSKQKWV